MTQVAQDRCQLVLQSSTEQQGMPLDLKSVAVLLCLVSLYFFEQPDFTDVNQMAQDCFQHRATRHAFCLEECFSAVVLDSADRNLQCRV